MTQELIRLTNRREQVLQQLIALAEPLPEYEILLSIPGIAETTATSIIGESLCKKNSVQMYSQYRFS